MIATRYTAWDGTQRVRLDADKVFERLSQFLSYTDDVQQALDWLMRQEVEVIVGTAIFVTAVIGAAAWWRRRQRLPAVARAD